MPEVVHSLPYPILEVGNRSYPKGYYIGNPSSLGDENSVLVNHQVHNASFITKMIADDCAQYGCLFSVPVTGHRKLYLSKDPSQKCEWDSGIVGEPPIIRPIIVATKTFVHQFSEDDEVANIWVGERIEILRGARLARDDRFRPTSTMKSLLNTKLEEKLPRGRFYVSPNSEQGYIFNVYVASDLYAFLASKNPDVPLRKSIAVNMVASCLSELKTSAAGSDEDDSWKGHSNLISLSRHLDNEGFPHWSDSDFQPEYVASVLYPLEFPFLNEEED